MPSCPQSGIPGSCAGLPYAPGSIKMKDTGES
jgi:hypothetical protein